MTVILPHRCGPLLVSMSIHATAVADVLASGSTSNQSTIAYMRATKDVEFLFGPEVKEYFDEIYDMMIRHHALEMSARPLTGDRLESASTKMDELFWKIADFPTVSTRLIAPYVRMHQKAFWF